MKKLCIALSLLACAMGAQAELLSYTISFGAENSSTASLTNDNFTSAVTAGKSYIAGVTSVVNVFPEEECIKLGSAKNPGKFNIHLSDGASIIPEYYIVRAARFDNDRDAEASIMLNSETVYIPSTTWEDYKIEIPTLAPQKVTNLIVDGSKRVYVQSITVVYDSANGTVAPEEETVAAPVFTPAGGTVSAGTLLTMSCSTEGATIRYTIDGEDPSAASEVYTAPFAINQSLKVKAIAMKDGMQTSEITEATFIVSDSDPEAAATFNFNEPTSLRPAVEEPEKSSWVDLDGRTFTAGDVAVSFKASSTGNTHVRLYQSYDAGCDVRIYDGETMTVASLNPSVKITYIEFYVSESGSSDIDLEASVGTYDYLQTTWAPAEDETVNEVTFTSNRQSRIKSMTVYTEHTSGIPSLRYENDTPATYYNINGVRVGANTPAPGFYIKVTDDSAEKIIVK